MTWDCQVQEAGELSLINYAISCSPKWLGQSRDTSGGQAAPDTAGISSWKHADRPGRCHKARAEEQSAYVLQDSYLPWPTGSTKANETPQKTDPERANCRTSWRMESMDWWGQQGMQLRHRTQHSWAAACTEKCIFFSPEETNYKMPWFWGKRDPDPQSASYHQQTHWFIS